MKPETADVTPISLATLAYRFMALWVVNHPMYGQWNNGALTVPIHYRVGRSNSQSFFRLLVGEPNEFAPPSIACHPCFDLSLRLATGMLHPWLYALRRGSGLKEARKSRSLLSVFSGQLQSIRNLCAARDWEDEFVRVCVTQAALRLVCDQGTDSPWSKGEIGVMGHSGERTRELVRKFAGSAAAEDAGLRFIERREAVASFSSCTSFSAQRWSVSPPAERILALDEIFISENGDLGIPVWALDEFAVVLDPVCMARSLLHALLLDEHGISNRGPSTNSLVTSQRGNYQAPFSDVIRLAVEFQRIIDWLNAQPKKATVTGASRRGRP